MFTLKSTVVTKFGISYGLCMGKETHQNLCAFITREAERLFPNYDVYYPTDSLLIAPDNISSQTESDLNECVACQDSTINIEIDIKLKFESLDFFPEKSVKCNYTVKEIRFKILEYSVFLIILKG